MTATTSTSDATTTSSSSFEVPPPPLPPGGARGPGLTDRPGRVLVLMVGGLLTLALLAFGTFNVVTLIAQDASTEPVSFPGSIRHLRVSIDAGDLTVVGGRGTERADVTGNRTVVRGLAAPAHTERIEGDTLVIEASCTAVFTWCSVSYSLSVPADIAVTVETSSGDVVVQGIDGDVAIATSSGDIQADAVGRLDARASSGDISVTGAEAGVVLHTRSGHVTANGLGGDADVETSSGDISLGFRGNPMQVDARASSGDVTIVVPADDASYRVTTQTSSGNDLVTVRTDPQGERQISASTSSGDIVVGTAPR